ncbi:MAG: DUF1801 domain-containing protein [Bacteroidota bacterium]
MKVDPHRNIDELYDSLPETERLTAGILRDLIRETLPEVREKLSWGAPFYHGRRSVCFVWPASIPWGKLTEGVALGFSRANQLDHGGWLGLDERKSIGRHVYLAPEDIDVEQVIDLLRQAWAIDQA